jgi:isopenicillin-N epimerase
MKENFQNHMKELKQYFLLDPNIIFLNHGSFGATPKPVFESYQRWQLELERQPVEFLGRRFNDLMFESRKALANFVGTKDENIVYVTNATVGLNIVAHSLILGPEDEVLSTDHEYGALDRTWRFLSREKGFGYINHHIPLPLTNAQDFVETLWQGVTSRTRVLFISHITSPSAVIFPIAEVCARARQEGILTVVDGAHVPGQIPIALDNLGVDFWSGNLHKWLMCPKGSGFLYAHPQVQHLLKPLVVSWGYEAEIPGLSTFVDHHEWQGTRDISAFLAVPDAIKFQQDHNWDLVRDDCFRLASQAQDAIVNLTGLSPIHRPNSETYKQMVAVPLPETTNMQSLKARLYNEYRIEVPLTNWCGKKLIRISVQGYNTQDEIEALLVALDALLPPRLSE